MGLFKKKNKNKTQSIDYSIPVPPASAFEPIAKAAVSEGKTVNEYMESHNVNSFNEPLDKLIDGDLPFGWVAHNSDFTEKIGKEFEYFRKQWADAIGKDPKSEYEALKSFLTYIDDVQKLCDEKGECFSFWCSEILVGQNWKTQLTDNLHDLETNMEDKIKEYNDKMEYERQRADFASSVTDEMIFDLINQNTGILQRDFYKLFDSPLAKEVISEKLYWLAKDGKIKRTKQGNTYKLEI